MSFTCSFSFFSAFFTVGTAHSASPLACGIFGLDLTCVNEYSLEISLNSFETNCGPLSDLKISGIPCLVNMDFNALSFHLISGTQAALIFR